MPDWNRFGVKVGVHRRDTKAYDPVGCNSRPVHVKKVMFVIFCIGVYMTYLVISGKA